MARLFERRRRECIGQIGDRPAPEFGTKEAILSQRTNFGACGLIFAQASRLRLWPNEEGVELGGSKKFACPVLGERRHWPRRIGRTHVEGLALPKFVEGGNFSFNKLVVWWGSA